MSKSPSLRRIQADIRELALDPSDRYHAAPIESDMFEWHFTIRGADETDFAGGWYHGRILLPPEYPFKPPSILFLTPSGRFETNVKVCLSFSAYHPELWQPAWGIRLILEALISFLPTPADGAIGSLDWSSKERQRLAKKSLEYCCPTCGKITDMIPKIEAAASCKQKDASSDATKSRFQKEIEHLKQLQQQEHHKTNENESTHEQVTPNSDDSNNNELEQRHEEDEQLANTATVSDDPVETDKVDHAVDEETLPAVNPTATPPVRPADVAQDEGDRTEPVERVDIAPALPQQPDPLQYIRNDTSSFFLSDPILHSIIIVLAAIIYLLLTKLFALAGELIDLGEDSEYK